MSFYMGRRKREYPYGSTINEFENFIQKMIDPNYDFNKGYVRKQIQLHINNIGVSNPSIIQLLVKKGFKFNHEILTRSFNRYLESHYKWNTIKICDLCYFIQSGAQLYNRKTFFNIIDNDHPIFELLRDNGYDFLKYHCHIFRSSLSVKELFKFEHNKKKYIRLQRILSILPFRVSYFQQLYLKSKNKKENKEFPGFHKCFQYYSTIANEKWRLLHQIGQKFMIPNQLLSQTFRLLS
mgnify:CR=1 FL=1